jgi:PPOX class probable F420-dependent enzyme
MPLSDPERARLRSARVGRLATADTAGRPNVVPVCFALAGDRVVTPVDEKPKRTTDLRRVRDVEANPAVALVVDEYTESWADLWWVQVRGRAAVVDPGEDGHDRAVEALRGKYGQYASHALGERSVLRVDPGHVRSWGRGLG